jgi:type II secretory pathway predicted ATPase ExeA
MMEWYNKLGFKNNPFSVDPAENHDTLVNMEEAIEEVFYRIDSGSILVVEGKIGSGKTTVLMAAAKKFGGKKNVAYVDCKVLDKKLNITHVLQDKYGLIGRLMNKTPRNMILLLDNVNELSKPNTERLKYYFDQNYIKSIIFATENYKKAKFSDSLRDRIGKRIVILPELNEELSIEIVKRRIGDSELFNDEIIKKIFKTSASSTSKLLKNCANVAEACAKKNRKRAQLIDLKILSSDIK